MPSLDSNKVLGKPCVKCGHRLRYKRGNRCVSCKKGQPYSWHLENPEKNRERSRQWYRDNKGKAREANSGWQKKNADKLARKAKERYKKDPDKVLAINLAWRDKNRGKIQEYNRKNHRRRQLAPYGLTPEEYDTILLAQGNRCAICGCPPPEERCLAVDHCHKTGRVRGVLCVRCNGGLGMFGEDTARMKRAIVYIGGVLPTTEEE